MYNRDDSTQISGDEEPMTVDEGHLSVGLEKTVACLSVCMQNLQQQSTCIDDKLTRLITIVQTLTT